ncbi:HXT9, partial [Symbiodinium pilosum]
MERVSERADSEATYSELRRWISKEYGSTGLHQLQEASKVSGNTSIKVLKDFFTWFRDEYPYYRGACKSCENNTDFLGLVRPGESERTEGGAGVCEMYFCT